MDGEFRGASERAGALPDDELNEASAGRNVFTIGDLAREFDVTLRALRFYEDKGLLTPRRQGLQRLYDRRDRKRLKLILMGKRVGFSLGEIREMLDLYETPNGQVKQLRDGVRPQPTMWPRRSRATAALPCIASGGTMTSGRLSKDGFASR